MLVQTETIEAGLSKILTYDDIVWMRFGDELHFRLTQNGISPECISEAFDFLALYADEVELQSDRDGAVLVVKNIMDGVELVEEESIETNNEKETQRVGFASSD